MAGGEYTSSPLLKSDYQPLITIRYYSATPSAYGYTPSSRKEIL